MYQSISSACMNGLTSEAINVQISATTGLPQDTIIGLPDTIVKESRNRIKSAIQLSGFELPAMNYTINLSPVDLKKQSNSLELAIAVAYLSVTSQIPTHPHICYLGALALDGRLEPIRHILPIINYYYKKDSVFVIPKKNLEDIHYLTNISVIPLDHLSELSGFDRLIPQKQTKSTTPIFSHDLPTESFDVVDGHSIAKRACAYAISGRHPLLFVGSPGIGKTMLMDRLHSLIPPMSSAQCIENMCIQSVLGQSYSTHATPPFQAPHHTISYAGMIGGQNPPKPGEITRANHGILFLDELGEYHRHILETLREPLETRKIQISRAGNTITFPANFLLAAAMNPCFCGYYFDDMNPCTCSHTRLRHYWGRVSKPLIDRFSICLILKKSTATTPSTIHHKDLQTMVDTAQKIQQSRNPNGCYNHDLSNNDCLKICRLTNDAQQSLHQWLTINGQSLRAKFRMIKLAQTIADCNGSEWIESHHIGMAIQLSEHPALP